MGLRILRMDTYYYLTYNVCFTATSFFIYRIKLLVIIWINSQVIFELWSSGGDVEIKMLKTALISNMFV